MQQFGQQRTASNCSGAAAGLEAHRGDAAVFDARGEAQDIAAGRVGDFHHGGGVFQVAGVARILEVVEDCGAVHGESIAERRAGFNARTSGAKAPLI